MSSRYFCRLEKKRRTEQWIAAIRGTDGKVATDIDGICRSWVDFFSTLFSADELDLKVQEDLLENLSVRLPSSSLASFDVPITLDEALSSISLFGRSWVRILSRFLHIFLLWPPTALLAAGLDYVPFQEGRSLGPKELAPDLALEL